MNHKLLIFATAATLSMAAQNLQKKLIAEIGFPFDVNGVSMPAGKYELTRTGSQPLLLVRDAATSKSAMVVGRGFFSNKFGASTLTFQRQGDQYFLKAVTDGTAGMVMN